MPDKNTTDEPRPEDIRLADGGPPIRWSEEILNSPTKFSHTPKDTQGSRRSPK